MATTSDTAAACSRKKKLHDSRSSALGLIWLPRLDHYTPHTTTTPLPSSPPPPLSRQLVTQAMPAAADPPRPRAHQRESSSYSIDHPIGSTHASAPPNYTNHNPSLSHSSSSDSEMDAQGNGSGRTIHQRRGHYQKQTNNLSASNTTGGPQGEFKSTLFTMAQAVVRCWLVIAMSFGINILNLLVFLTVRPWSRLTARRLIGDWWQRMWVSVMSYLLPKSEMILTGDVLLKTIDTSRPAIIIANHQVDADFWYVWEVARAYGMHGRLKIILKAELAVVPIVGWGMKQFEFCFLQRNWQRDRRAFTRLLSSFVEDGYKCALLLFPEGTTINTEAVMKSHRFGREQNRPHLNYCVLPRSTGFAALVETMCQSPQGLSPVIYDLTLAYHGYSGEVPTYEMHYDRKRDFEIPNVLKMMQGRACPQVHVHVKTYEVDEALVANPEQWLDARWVEKDALLERFIQTQSFNGEGREEKRVIHPQGSLVSLLFLLVLPLIMTFLSPVLLLLTLVAWPLILLAGTLNFLNFVSRSAMGVVAGGSSSSSPPTYWSQQQQQQQQQLQQQRRTSSNSTSSSGSSSSSGNGGNGRGVNRRGTPRRSPNRERRGQTNGEESNSPLVVGMPPLPAAAPAAAAPASPAPASPLVGGTSSPRRSPRWKVPAGTPPVAESYGRKGGREGGRGQVAAAAAAATEEEERD